MKFSEEGLTNLVEDTSSIEIGDGNHVKATKRGVLRGIIVQQDGTRTAVMLGTVKVVPDLTFNLFSVNTALTGGCKQTATKD